MNNPGLEVREMVMSTKTWLGLTIVVVGFFTYTSNALALVAFAISQNYSGIAQNTPSECSVVGLHHERGSTAEVRQRGSMSRSPLESLCPESAGPVVDNDEWKLKELLALIAGSTCDATNPCEEVIWSFRGEIDRKVLRDLIPMQRMPLAGERMLHWTLDKDKKRLGFHEDTKTRLIVDFDPVPPVLPLGSTTRLSNRPQNRPQRFSWEVLFNLGLLFLIIERYRTWR
jgi:hypothetical protein